MFKIKTLVFTIIVALSQNVMAQKPAIALSAATAGGYYQNYFDLGENGFIVVLNKKRNDLQAANETKETSNTAYYFSKDLNKRAIIKYSSLDKTSFLVNENFIVLLEKNVYQYFVKVYDFNGKLISTKKIDLEQAGLTTDKISRTFLSSNNRLNYEVYDLSQGLHIFYNDLMEAGSTDIIEADIALPSNNPFSNLNFQSQWRFLSEYKGYYSMYRIGNNMQYNPTISMLHIAMYDTDFKLFREFSSNNLLATNETLMGNDIALDLNTQQQSFILSYINKMDSKYGYSIQKLKFDNLNNDLKTDWKKDVMFINNATNKFIDEQNIPKAPVVKPIGSSEEIFVSKDRLTLVDEAVNQISIIDASGKLIYNNVQMGDFDMLNLDGFCGDNSTMYSRFDNLQMKPVLKKTCECLQCEVLDINVDDKGNELLMVNNFEKHVVNIYQFKK